jgi:CBS domain-containing protein
MREPTVTDVMTRQVITAVPDTPFKDLAGAMLAHGVDTLPVIDSIGRPIGMITETDIMAKLEFHGGADAAPLLAGAHCRERWRKSTALCAADLMTTPAITISPDVPVSAAIRLLSTMRVRHICVVNCVGYLVGVLGRRDALHLFVRTDSAIEADIDSTIATTIHHPDRVTAYVTDGIVTLDGTLTLHSGVELLGHAVHRIPGVITVRNNIRYDVDDLMITGL